MKKPRLSDAQKIELQRKALVRHALRIKANAWLVARLEAEVRKVTERLELQSEMMANLRAAYPLPKRKS